MVKSRLFLIIAGLAVMVGLISTNAAALADSLGYARSYQVVCGTTPARMCRSGYCQFQAFKFSVPAGTPIFVGGSDVNQTDKGFSYVGEKESIDGNPGAFFCTAASDVTVTVIAGRK
jgi:hypothetical protein